MFDTKKQMGVEGWKQANKNSPPVFQNRQNYRAERQEAAFQMK